MTPGPEQSLRVSAPPDLLEHKNNAGTAAQANTLALLAKGVKCLEQGERRHMGSDRGGVLKEIGDMLAAGLKTQIEPFPETDKEFADILVKLRQLDPNDLQSKLVISGFVDHPYGPDKQRCMECMYYLVHRRWCDLPELAVPVEPDWWCRLWRI
jgi:hypothetical protein